jgi:pimeloyl-ACP methyl ester carboxylesterase
VLDIGPKVDPTQSTFTLTQYISDATDVLNAARKLPQLDASQTILLGHSEGTMTASAVAQSTDGNGVAAVVLVGVVGFDIKTTLRYQIIDRTLDSLAADPSLADGTIDPETAVAIVGQGYPSALEAAAKVFGLVQDAAAPSGYRFDKAMDTNGDGKATIDTELRVYMVNNYEQSFPNLTGYGLSERCCRATPSQCS